MEEENQSANSYNISYGRFSDKPSSKDVTLAMTGFETLDELYALPFEVWTKITPITTQLLYGSAGEQMGGDQWRKFFDENMDAMKKVGDTLKQPGVSSRDAMRLGQALTGLLPTYGQDNRETTTLAEREAEKKPSGDDKGTIGGAKVSEAKLRRRRSLLGG